MHNIVIHTALACFASISLIVLLRNTALRMGLVDYPGGRKQHEGGVPVVGGIAIYGAFAFSALLITQTQPLYPFRSLLGGMGVLVLAGALDDMHDLSPIAKLGMQCGAALLMVSWGGVFVPQLGDLFGIGGVFALGNFAIPFTLVCVLGVINALNMTDGVDGLAGGLALVSLLAFALLCVALNLDSSLLMISILIGAVLGFLFFNFRSPLRQRAGVFLGDAGSMALGFALCWFAVSLARIPDAAVPPIAMVWLLAVPLLDMSVVIVRRLLSGRSPLSADRGHLHHILLRAGLSDTATTLTLLLVSAICAGIGLAIWRYQISSAWSFYGFVLLVAVTTTATRIATRHFEELNSQPAPDDSEFVIPDSERTAQAGSVLTLGDSELRESRKR
ncbi:MAG: MraY family glycosyltransferase [Casimicrobiaceae bacterium]